MMLALFLCSRLGNIGVHSQKAGKLQPGDQEIFAVLSVTPLYQLPGKKCVYVARPQEREIRVSIQGASYVNISPVDMQRQVCRHQNREEELSLSAFDETPNRLHSLVSKDGVRDAAEYLMHCHCLTSKDLGLAAIMIRFT
jgi:hypothetical protein